MTTLAWRDVGKRSDRWPENARLRWGKAIRYAVVRGDGAHSVVTGRGSDSRSDLGDLSGVGPRDVGVFGDPPSIHLADGIGHRLDHADEIRPEGTIRVTHHRPVGPLAVEVGVQR